jgi:hypothetical protein
MPLWPPRLSDALDLQPDASISYVEDYALAVDGYKASMIVKMGKKDALLDS